MPSLGQVTLALTFLLASAASAADDAISREWVRLIKAQFQDGCVKRLDQYLTVSGINGARGGAWLVQTCEGNYEYGSSYFPPGVLPERKRLGVSRTQKLRPLTPVQLKEMYDLKG